MSSAECARRTGLTVRTLRVYGHAGLTHRRAAPMVWRVCGERELQRLNDVITRKTLGLTLRENAMCFRLPPGHLSWEFCSCS